MTMSLANDLVKVGFDMGGCWWFDNGFECYTLGIVTVSCRCTLGSGAGIASGTLGSDAGEGGMVDV